MSEISLKITWEWEWVTQSKVWWKKISYELIIIEIEWLAYEAYSIYFCMFEIFYS